MKAFAYTHVSRIGTFIIARQADGQWQVCLGDNVLDGSYLTAQQALADLAGGHGYWPESTDPSTLGLAEEIEGWTPHARRP